VDIAGIAGQVQLALHHPVLHEDRRQPELQHGQAARPRRAVVHGGIDHGNRGITAPQPVFREQFDPATWADDHLQPRGGDHRSQARFTAQGQVREPPLEDANDAFRRICDVALPKVELVSRLARFVLHRSPPSFGLPSGNP